MNMTLHLQLCRDNKALLFELEKNKPQFGSKDLQKEFVQPNRWRD